MQKNLFYIAASFVLLVSVNASAQALSKCPVFQPGKYKCSVLGQLAPVEIVIETHKDRTGREGVLFKIEDVVQGAFECKTDNIKAEKCTWDQRLADEAVRNECQENMPEIAMSLVARSQTTANSVKVEQSSIYSHLLAPAEVYEKMKFQLNVRSLNKLHFYFESEGPQAAVKVDAACSL